ncbi:AraC family transcriptional regulator [Variovorax guangxiensis]|uniref:AraC family transcriptional regulator n=1 Tax=Variovorax guangxiensis TaxID=1775474 RepID=UPI002859CCD9|nr:AraC family transcriptional regulator [Variovorax guangxiensis]MDR6854876.1 AraC-like DNA-binding protein [Variovorax guangxiensis]
MNKRKQTSRSEEAERFEAVRSSLAERIARWTAGVEQFATGSPGLTLYRHDAPTEAMSCILEPAIALTIQGAKRALLGDDVFAYNRHRFLITSLDLPVVLRTVEASCEAPYLSLVLRLDERAIAELMLQTELPRPTRERPLGRGISLGKTTTTLLEVFDRLVKLLDEPAAVPVLAPLIRKEIFYRLLVSDQGALLRQLASAGSQSRRVARAIDWLKSNFAVPLHIEELAALSQMSTSRLHHHFRQLTSMSPLQFQKLLRLNEARRLMLTEQLDASAAAFQVGYLSPSQFSREYSRQFGAPPRRDIERLLHLYRAEAEVHA